MSNFAKIERASDGAQVLFYKSTNEDGHQQLRQVTEYEGFFAELNASFKDTDSGWESLDAAFQKAGQQQADAVRTAIRAAFGE